MGWFKNRQNERLMELLAKLEDANIKRLELEAIREEKRHALDMRKLELEADHIEEMTKARIAEADAKLERRQKAREWGAAGAAKRAQNQQASQPPACPVCANPGSAALSATDIAWHHSGHQPNFQAGMEWN